MDKTAKKIVINISILIILILVVYFGFIYVPNGTLNVNLVQCISEKSELYVQQGCPACDRQEKLFGEFISHLNIIDCSKDFKICSDNFITHTPTWIINDEKYQGYQSMEKLKELTGC
ncbi:MAG: hypothetical protein U9Q06_04370 [Nanoarchaeota archaeon]|nr:hypothetical protein [Nanoarchaeota archaeon]